MDYDQFKASYKLWSRSQEHCREISNRAWERFRAWEMEHSNWSDEDKGMHNHYTTYRYYDDLAQLYTGNCMLLRLDYPAYYERYAREEETQHG